MDAKELMLNDWVLLMMPGSTDKKYEKCQLHSIDNIDKGFISCEPIPLTKEILSANGFYTYTTKDKSYTEFKLKLEFSKDIDEYEYEISGHFRYDAVLLCIYKTRWIDRKEGKCDNYCAYSSGSSFYKERVINVHEFQHALRVCHLVDLADNLKIE